MEVLCAEMGKVAREKIAMVRKKIFDLVIHSTSGEKVITSMSAE